MRRMEVVGSREWKDERQLEHQQVRTTYVAIHQHSRRRRHRRRLFPAAYPSDSEFNL